MSGLVTPAMLDRLRGIGAQQLITPVVIKRRSTVETDYGSQEVWTTVATTKGWLRMMNTPRLAEQTGVIGAIGAFRLHLPVGTDIDEGDQVYLASGSDAFVVQDVNTEDTVQMFTTALLRKMQ